MCFGVEPKAKYYYQEEIIPSRPHRDSSFRDSSIRDSSIRDSSIRDSSIRDSRGDYYYHHHRHSSHNNNHSPRASYMTVDRYNNSPRVSTYSPRVSTSSVRRTVPTRVVYKETTQSRYT